MYLLIRCDAVPGKLAELDSWLKTHGTQFWAAQSEVKNVEIYGDMLVGYPERTLLIEVNDFTKLQQILASTAHAQFRNGLLTYGTDVQTQILERIAQKY